MLSRLHLKPTALILQSKLLVKPQTHFQILRSCAYDGRDTSSSRNSRRRTLKEQAMAPAGNFAIDTGQILTAGGALIGLGALGFYGLGMSKEAGVVDHAVMWPDYVRQRIKDTYMYFGGSIALTAASATAVYRSPSLLYALVSGGYLSIALTMVLQIGSMLTVMFIPYHEGFGAKQIAWLGFNGIVMKQ